MKQIMADEFGKGAGAVALAVPENPRDRDFEIIVQNRDRHTAKKGKGRDVPIIRLVEQSHLPARRTLEKLGVSRATFYRWCDLYQTGGPEALEDRSPRPDRVWNRIPNDVRGEVVQLALEEPELSPRELATRFTDTKSYFVSEASVYRLLKDHDLIASPAYIVIKAADEFKDKTTAPNQLD